MTTLPDLPPLLPCDACLTDPACCVTIGEVVAVYCEHHEAGLHCCGGLFTLYAPVSRETYLGMVTQLEARMRAGRQRQAAN